MSLLEQIKQPRTIDESALDLELLLDLTLKHFYDGGLLDLHQLADRMALTGNMMEGILALLSQDASSKLCTLVQGFSCYTNVLC